MEVPLAQQILNLLGSLRSDLGYSDAFILPVPRFVEIIVLGGNEAILSA